MMAILKNFNGNANVNHSMVFFTNIGLEQAVLGVMYMGVGVPTDQQTL